MSVKRVLIFVCACSTAVLLPALPASAQRRGGGTEPAPVSRPSGRPMAAGPYRQVQRYGGYYGVSRPYLFNGFYTTSYGFGWYPSYFDLAFGYPYGLGGYPWRYPYPYPYPYRYNAWSSVRLQLKPRDAQVYVDGYYVGVVDDFDGVFQRLDVPSGEHEIAVYLPGYQTYRQRTLFRPGGSYHYKAILEPLPAGASAEPKPQPSPNTQTPPQGYGQPGYPPPAPPRGEPGRTQPMPPRREIAASGFGTLSLRVQPADAVVQIDGERWDSPDGGSRLVVELASGPHRLDVRKDGFRAYTTTIQIRAGEPQTLNVVLPEQK